MTNALQPRATLLTAALPALTKREARLLAGIISAAVRELCDHQYRALVDFTVDDEHVGELIVDFMLEPSTQTWTETQRETSR